MPKRFRPKTLPYLIHTALASSVVLPALAQSQDSNGNIEEVVVTGSFLRNSAFAGDTAMDTITAEDIVNSGAPNMSEYIRDLTYVQNVDVVAVVLGGQDGPQSSNGGSFNLRGLGENSTLTLIDGVRTLDSSLAASFPQIAMERMEVVLDGGSALYGSDAVAGVVNLIPMKEYNGVEFRTFYQRPEDGANEEMRLSALWGRSFDNGISYVGAFESYLRTPIMWYERPREHSRSQGTSSSGNPGTFKELVGVDDIVPGQPHSGTLVGDRMVDPSCGTFNEGTPPHGHGPSPLPSGTLFGDPVGGFCTFEYSAQAEVINHNQRYNLYNNLNWEATDNIQFGLMLNNFVRHVDGKTTFASPNPNANRQLLLVPAEHPANPYGYDVAPDTWRVFTHPQEQFLPEGIDQDTSRSNRSIYSFWNAKAYAEYDVSDTWSGQTYYSKQENRVMADVTGVSTSRLQLALTGRGGPTGDQWWNPFGSQDTRSPFHEPGLENSKELNDWISYRNPNFVSARNELEVFESLLSGEAFELPNGPVLTAFGYQWRELTERTFQEPYNASGENFIWGAVGGFVPPDETFVSDVRALFAEVEVPILPGLAAKAAVRHEQFKNQGLEATVPKVSVRYELLPELALRASWGESFLAPTSFQTREARTDENCGDMFSGIDPLSGELLLGGQRCSAGNPNLSPESAEITNFGFTWQPTGVLEGLELSADYQSIEYSDRIRTLSEDDVTRNQFLDMLRATGQSEASYDPTPGTQSRTLADTWLGSQPVGGSGGNIFRNPQTGKVDLVLTQSSNVATFDVELIDMKASYRFTPGDLGTFNTRLSATFYTDYIFSDIRTAGEVDVLGKQNALTNIAPPLPELNLSWQTNWFRNNHSASVSVNWWSEIERDNNVINLYPFDPFTVEDELSTDPIVDVRYAYLFEDFFGSEITLSGGVNNLFEFKPQITGQIGGFETRLSDNFYRQLFISLDWRPGG
jgi:outer membrane receptor protein involved in Fe transport